jgi:hypothetical protein
MLENWYSPVLARLPKELGEATIFLKELPSLHSKKKHQPASDWCFHVFKRSF